MAIQIRRGDYDDMDANLLVDGELVATTQDDPNYKNGRGVYIKNGTLQKIITDETDTSFTLLDTITLSSNSSEESLFTTSDDYDEYIIVVNGTLSATTGNVYLKIGAGSTADDKPVVDNPFCRAYTIKRLVGNDAVVVNGINGQIFDIDNKEVKIKTDTITIQSGTVIKIYAR